jgi:hypothetical protein
MQGYHDLGGQPAGAINKAEHALAFWEKRVHAMQTLLSDPCVDLVSTHELRRGIESLGEAEYDRLSYYERWITAMTTILLQKGVLTPEALGAKLADIEAREGHEP